MNVPDGSSECPWCNGVSVACRSDLLTVDLLLAFYLPHLFPFPALVLLTRSSPALKTLCQGLLLSEIQTKTSITARCGARSQGESVTVPAHEECGLFGAERYHDMEGLWQHLDKGTWSRCNCLHPWCSRKTHRSVSWSRDVKNKQKLMRFLTEQQCSWHRGVMCKQKGDGSHRATPGNHAQWVWNARVGWGWGCRRYQGPGASYGISLLKYKQWEDSWKIKKKKIKQKQIRTEWCNQNAILEKDNLICNVKNLNCNQRGQTRVWKLSTREMIGPDPG